MQSGPGYRRKVISMEEKVERFPQKAKEAAKSFKICFLASEVEGGKKCIRHPSC